jgi:NADH-quinone oxidoreductase subunit L
MHGGGPVARWAAWLVLVVGLATVAVTAAYATRLWLMVFVGPPRNPNLAHEAPPVMRWPLIVLAVPTVLLGFLGLRASWLPGWLSAGTPGGAERFHFGAVTSLLSVLLLLAGAAVAHRAWRRAYLTDPAARLGRLRPAFDRAFYVDDAYDAAVVRPVRDLAGITRLSDLHVVDAWVRGTGAVARGVGAGLRRSQSGNVQTYLTVLVAGVVLAIVGAVVGT